MWREGESDECGGRERRVSVEEGEEGESDEWGWRVRRVRVTSVEGG